MMDSLWGDDFAVETTQSTAKKVSEKINNPKKVVKKSGSNKKATISIVEQMNLIKTNVYKILGKYKDPVRPSATP